jgi:hypothetical protein
MNELDERKDRKERNEQKRNDKKIGKSILETKVKYLSYCSIPIEFLFSFFLSFPCMHVDR